ncbi:cytochrome b/b6 domain-containing protein [Parasphingorhabdus sp. JC815]|uniref:cytochrome b/b6 domain-containing protein n=1 Tax=Parasphingorhabdus sp. JC815 TaxID=3232140 RepID=UPI0034575F10
MTEERSIKPLKKHRLPTRIWHWVNALCILVMVMSGLTIFNAHPRLYWGEYGANDDYAWAAVGSSQSTGYVRIGNRKIDTTGYIGNWRDSAGNIQTWAIPGWATIPSYYSLAEGRRWHFFFAWVFSIALTLFMIISLLNRHVQRDIHIKRAEWQPSHIWRDIKNHLRLRFHEPESTHIYNILQKFSYIAVIFVLLPLMVFTGLAMSPAMDANWPWLTDIFGGRQSARSIHFLGMFSLVLFFIFHMIALLLAGPIKQTWAMIAGGEREAVIK